MAYLIKFFLTIFFTKHKKYLNNKIKYLDEKEGKVLEIPECLSFSTKGSSIILNFFDLQ